QSRVLDAINQVFQEALTCETEEALARKCLAVAEQLTGSKFGFIGEVNPAGRFDTIALSDPSWDVCRMPKTNAVLLLKNMEIRGIWGSAIRDERSVIANDLTAHPDRVGAPESHPPLTCFLGAPLKQAGKTIGMIGLANRKSGYNHTQREDVETLSVAIVEALMRKRAEDRTRREGARTQALLQVAARLNAQLDLETVLDAVCEETVHALNVPAASVTLYDDEHQVFCHVATFGCPLEYRERAQPMPRATYDELARRMGPIIVVPDVQAIPGLLNADLYARHNTRTVVGATMLRNGQLVGGLNVFTFGEVRHFGEDELALLQGLADQAAQAIINARLLAETRQRADRLALLNRIVRALSSTLHLDELLEIVYREITATLEAEAFFICLYDRAADELDFRIRVDKGVRKPQQRRPLNPGLTSSVVTNKRPLLIRDYEQEKEHLPPVQVWGTMEAPPSWLGVPMLLGADVVGVISVQAYRPNAYGEAEQELLATIADAVAVAIESTRLYEAVQRELAERKRAQEALAQERILLRTVIDNLPDAIYVKDAATRKVLANRADLENIGRPEAEVLGKTDWDVFPAEVAAHFYADDRAVLQSGQAVIAREELLVNVSGQSRWLLTSKLPLRDDEGRITGIVGIGRDITELVCAREAQQHYAARLEAMHEIDQATLAAQPVEAIAETALRGLRRLVPCRRASVALFDPAQAEATVLAVLTEGQTKLAAGDRIPLEDIQIEDLRGGVVRVIGDLLAIPHLSPTLQTLQAEGVRSLVNVPLLAEGELIGMLSLAADRPGAFTTDQEAIARRMADQLAVAIQQTRLREQVQRHTAELEQRVTERTAELAETAARLQVANERLKELDQLKSQFVANVSHELRTPLTNIKAYLYLLEHGKPEKHAQYMTTLHSETAHLEHLIKDLLDLSWLDQGKIRIQLAALDVNRVIAMLVDARALLVRQAGLTLEVLPQPALPPALADADRLMQVLINLLTNAINYTPQGGTLTLRTALQQAEGRSWVTVAVSDTGLGIAAADLPHVFERFYRGTAAQQRNVPGTGLGLTICQEIVQRHNGRITVESEVGKGSTFTVWLPVGGDGATG
ncbi:MAG: GAF domain-containing protein, partial [Chloroflexi bacterium]|nr:GAF domain-containing protein [Chloroflexota bacterium]